VARELLGLLLCHQTPHGLLVGRIVETEAYLGATDLASHSARGRTKRNYLMFEAPGHAYVYFSYGNHWCFNTVAYAKPPGAVLVRALEPVEGMDVMTLNRGLSNPRDLTNGPGKLTKALDIGRAQNAAALFESASPLYIARPTRSRPKMPVVVTPRIGISKSVDLPLRFYVADSPYVSRRRALDAALRDAFEGAS